MKHRPLCKLGERFVAVCGLLRMRGGVPKIALRICETVGFELDGFAGSILSNEDEVAVIGYENLTVFRPIAANLLAIGRNPSVIRGGLNLDNAASGILGKRLSLPSNWL